MSPFFEQRVPNVLRFRILGKLIYTKDMPQPIRRTFKAHCNKFCDRHLLKRVQVAMPTSAKTSQINQRGLSNKDLKLRQVLS